MDAHHPVIFDADAVHANRPVTVCADVDRGVVEAAVRGRWDRRVQVEAVRTMAKCFAQSPRAVLVDLRTLRDPTAASAPTWWTAGMRGVRLEPAVLVVLCLPAGTPLTDRLRRLGAQRCLPIYPNLTQARAALDSRLPLTDRQQLRLEPDPHAPSLARDLVGLACSAWGLPALLYRGRVVMSELVHNALGRVRAEIVVTVTRRGPGLHLAVTDDDPHPPRLRGPAPDRGDEHDHEPGLGLRIVQANASMWGSTPTSTGKVVWAYLQ